jgi:hypothetical protein
MHACLDGTHGNKMNDYFQYISFDLYYKLQITRPQMSKEVKKQSFMNRVMNNEIIRLH